MTSSKVFGRRLTIIFPEHEVSFPPSLGPTSTSDPSTFLVINTRQSAPVSSATLFNLSNAKSQSFRAKPIESPLSSNPRSNIYSPFPSSNRPVTYSVNCLTLFPFVPPPLSSRTCFKRMARDSSARPSWSIIASSSSWSSRIGLGVVPAGFRLACCFWTYSAKSLRALQVRQHRPRN
jgi:hypothetical protein